MFYCIEKPNDFFKCTVVVTLSHKVAAVRHQQYGAEKSVGMSNVNMSKNLPILGSVTTIKEIIYSS